MKNYSKVFGYATTKDLQQLYDLVANNHSIKLVKAPQKTLTMIQVREPAGNSLFYLGEAICTECMVSVDDIRGFSVLLGDDYEKAVSTAVIDAVMHSDFVEKDAIVLSLTEIEAQNIAEKSYVNAEIQKSKVDFNLMGE